jgi:hypothetical protein
LGKQVAMIDANGIVTCYEYDSLNRQVVVVENQQVGDESADEWKMPFFTIKSRNLSTDQALICPFLLQE